MTRPRLVIGNWKMNPATIAAAVDLARAVAPLAAQSAVRVGVAPPAIALPAVADAARGSHLEVYAQDVHWEEKGAYTSQMAASMLAGIAEGTIVGHSEVRRDQGDDDARVAKKLARATRSGLRVVLCVGEKQDEFDEGATEDVLAGQMAPALRALRDADRDGTAAARFTVAYEPVWAIGTGRAATAEHATAATKTIRAVIREEIALDGERIPILYGGSVTKENAAEFAHAEGIDGALVGGASLKPDDFALIVKAFA